MDAIFSPVRGIPKQIKDSVRSGRNTMVFFAAQNNRCHLAANLGVRFLYLASDLVEGKKIYDRIRSYGDGNYALLPEREDVLIERKICDYNVIAERLKILRGMADGTLDGVVVTCESLLGFYPDRKRLEENVLTFRTGEETDVGTLAERLVACGYKRVEEPEKAASFRLKGDILEIFPVGEGKPYRVSFFGDEVEEIRPFLTDTHVVEDAIKELSVLPATEYIVYQNEIEGIRNSVLKVVRGKGAEVAARVKEAWENFLMNPSSPLNTFFLPFIGKSLGTLYEYAKGFTLVIDDVRTAEDKLRLTRKAFENRVETAIEGGKLLPCHFDSLPTEEDAENFNGTILGFGRITSSVRFFTPKEVYNLRANPLPPYYNDMESFFETVRSGVAGGMKVRVYAGNEDAKQALIRSFHDHDIGIRDGFDESADVAIDVGDVEYGFIYPSEKLLCVGVHDLSRKNAPVRRQKPAHKAFVELPQKGDYVVHETHGIGISEGFQRIQTRHGEKEMYVIVYRGGDRLMLPPEQLNTIEKYNGVDHPALHALGGAEFERVKNRVRASVKEMAIDLLEVSRARYNRKGHVYQPDTPWQREMEEDFEFTETDDQLAAIADIKNDMESGKIMDRLLCGDVGYGKTEVALRAVFKTVIEGKQAAILAPTTILAQQHYNLINARFNKYKFNIELLSRFVSPADIKKSLERIRSGKSNIIVATHRLLSKDVAFYDLGLLVLDEEQRFGVEHKEKLKTLRNDVNVLSLSATPIPRTLHMALSGIRDISTLETPPRNRLPVETYVTEYSDDLLKTALEKELSRGGQAFVLYNRVQGIEGFYKQVAELVGDRTEVVYAHGQMDEERMENAIKRFYDGDAGVLVSTTIIENGIDLPSANTLFVIDADRLGLSQLYQLRGRVGRSDVLAYAYFTVREGKVLTDGAVKRLDALMANTELGSGFRIAMRDLEIRGAGNVLGREQHGQMEKVGYEMYLKLVQEGIDEAQGKPTQKELEPELKIDAAYSLDERYMPDSKARIAVYRAVAELASTQEGVAYYRELKEKYGKSETLKALIRIGVLRNVAKKTGVKKIVVDKTGTGIYFFDAKSITDERLFVALEEYKECAVLIPTTPPNVVFQTKNLTLAERTKLVKDFLETMSSK